MLECKTCGCELCQQPFIKDPIVGEGPKYPFCGWVVDGDNNIWTIELAKFLKEMREEQKDTDPEIQKVVNDRFYKLLEEGE